MDVPFNGSLSYIICVQWRVLSRNSEASGSYSKSVLKAYCVGKTTVNM